MGRRINVEEWYRQLRSSYSLRLIEHFFEDHFNHIQFHVSPVQERWTENIFPHNLY